MLSLFTAFLVVGVLAFAALTFLIAYRLWRLDPLSSEHELRLGYSRFPDSILLEVAKENNFFDKLSIELEQMEWNEVYQALSRPQAEQRLDIAYTNRNAAMHGKVRNSARAAASFCAFCAPAVSPFASRADISGSNMVAKAIAIVPRGSWLMLSA